MSTDLSESRLLAENAAFREVVPAGEPFMKVISKDQVVRILDLKGNQAVDTLFYSASAHPREGKRISTRVEIPKALQSTIKTSDS